MKFDKPVLAVALFSLFAGTTPATAAGRDKLLVVVSRAENNVSLYKAVGPSLTLVKSLPVGKTPREVCLSPDGKRAYVAAQEGNSVTVVDLDAHSVVATLANPELGGADGCGVSPDGKKLYVVSTKRDSVAVFSTSDHKLIKDVKLPLSVPRRVAFTPDAKQLYVGSNKTPEIAILDTATDSVVKTFKTGNESRGGLAFTADGKTFFVGNVEDDTVAWYDTTTHQVIKTMGVPLSPQRIEISKDGKFAYVLTRMGGQEGGETKGSPVLFAMPITDKHDASRFVRVGQAPWGLAVSDDGGHLYVSSNADSTITVIDGHTLKVLATVPVNKDPQAVAFRP